MDFSQFPSLHPLLVHFPIILLLIAFFFQASQFFAWNDLGRQRLLSLIAFMFILSGFIGAYIAGNFFNPAVTGLAKNAKNIFELHRDLAGYTIWAAKIAAILKFFSHFLMKKRLVIEIMNTLLFVACAILVLFTAHYGAYLVHIEGIGPQGNFLSPDE